MASASRSSRRNRGPRPITDSTPVDVRQWVPTSTFSSAVMCGKSLMFWNVRATPALVTRSGRRGSGLPRKDTAPDVGVTSPVRQLKNVVLPAPLGPMSPTISRSPTERSTASTASSPPKRFDTARASSNAVMSTGP